MFCENCKVNHGDLYVCPSYDDDTKIKLQELGKRFRQKCKDGTMPIIVNGTDINPKSTRN